MNDYTYFVIKFIELAEKEKLGDGTFLLHDKPTGNQLYKIYTELAQDYGLGNSKSAFEKGLFSMLTSWFIFKRVGSAYHFSPSHYKEFKEKFGEKEEKRGDKK